MTLHPGLHVELLLVCLGDYRIRVSEFGARPKPQGNKTAGGLQLDTKKSPQHSVAVCRTLPKKFSSLRLNLPTK